MKKFVNAWLVIALVLLLFGGVEAQVYVDQWGKTSNGTAWPIGNTAATPAGMLRLEAVRFRLVATIRGGFNQTYEATTSQAVL
jgi:hypothetical protein